MDESSLESHDVFIFLLSEVELELNGFYLSFFTVCPSGTDTLNSPKKNKSGLYFLFMIMTIYIFLIITTLD